MRRKKTKGATGRQSQAEKRAAALRSERARKGWETRRARAAEAERLRAARSERARKGWETRRARAAEREKSRTDRMLAALGRVPVAKDRRGKGRPDPDYMLALAEDYDFDVSALYDLFYGYAPGSSGGRR